MLFNMAAGNDQDQEMQNFFGKLDAIERENMPVEIDWFVKGKRWVLQQTNINTGPGLKHLEDPKLQPSAPSTFSIAEVDADNSAPGPSSTPPTAKSDADNSASDPSSTPSTAKSDADNSAPDPSSTQSNAKS
jgi:hypothetical protein